MCIVFEKEISAAIVITVNQLKTFVFTYGEDQDTCSKGNAKTEKESNTEIVCRFFQGLKFYYRKVNTCFRTLTV